MASNILSKVVFADIVFFSAIFVVKLDDLGTPSNTEIVAGFFELDSSLLTSVI
jgi:hypothetical protein